MKDPRKRFVEGHIILAELFNLGIDITIDTCEICSSENAK